VEAVKPDRIAFCRFSFYTDEVSDTSVGEQEGVSDPQPADGRRTHDLASRLPAATQALLDLRRQRFLLDEDVAILLEQAIEQAHNHLNGSD
jgi:hypothetical protein